MPQFVSIATAFEYPADLLTTPDIESALAKLRQIASPTSEYHSELLKLVQSARSLDTAHLLLFVRGSYFTAADVERIESELRSTVGSSDAETCLRRQIALRDNSLLSGYATMSTMILTSGLKRTQVASWEEAMEILNEALPSEGVSDAFFSIAEKFAPLSNDRAHQLMQIADKKLAREAAGYFALQWFESYTDGSFESLITLAGQLTGSTKDILLAGALSRFQSFSINELYKLIEAGFSKKGEITGLAFLKCETFSHAIVLDLLSRLDDRHRGDFLANATARYDTMTMNELRELLNSTRSRRGDIVRIAATRISDTSVDGVALIARLLSGNAKDEWIASALPKFESIQTSEVISLIKSAYSSDLAISKELLPRINDLTVQNALLIANELHSQKKDSFLLSAVELVTDLDVTSLQKMAAASESAGIKIIELGENRLGI